MKKIIAVIALMLGVGFTASAQQKAAAKATVTKAQAEPGSEAAIHEAAVKDLTALKSLVKLDGNMEQAFAGLFEYKHRALSTEGLTQQRRDLISESVEAKLRAGLSADDMALVEAKPEVLKQLTH